MLRSQSISLVAVFLASLLTNVNVARSAEGEYRDKDLAEWVEISETGDNDERRQAYYAIGQIRPIQDEAVAALTAGLEDSTVVGRRYALAAMGEMGAKAAPAIEAIVANIEHEKIDDLSIRFNGLRTLGKIGPAAKEAIPVLESFLTQDSGVLRVAAANSLYQIDQRRTAFSPLVKALADEDGNVSFAAATTLLEIGPVEPLLISFLVDAMKHSDADTRRAAGKAAAQFQLAALPKLTEALTNSNYDQTALLVSCGLVFETVRQNKLHASAVTVDEFAETEELLQPCLSAIENLLVSETTAKETRTEASVALSRIGMLSIPHFLRSFSTENADVKQQVVDGLVRSETNWQPNANAALKNYRIELVPQMLKSLQSSNTVERHAALRLFAVLPIGADGEGKEAVSILRQALREETDGAARAHASQALKRLEAP